MNNHDSTLAKTVTLLNDSGYHDGTTIGQQLNITRAAVWKTIKKLQQYGIAISSIKGKGYKLDEPLILLNHKQIISLLTNNTAALEILEKINSTNTYLQQYVAADDKQLRICIAEMQTAGYGRRQRHWHSPFARNIYLSLRYHVAKDVRALSGLSLIVSMAVCRTLDAILQHRHQVIIKWPNDILIAGKKIAGILIEIKAEANGFCQVIIGIGINVNITTADMQQITQPWTSLQNLTAEYYDRNILCALLINHVVEYLQQFTQHDLDFFMDEWRKYDGLFKKPIALISGKDSYHGIGAGINNYGHLQLQLASGDLHSFSSGDTTLLPIDYTTT